MLSLWNTVSVELARQLYIKGQEPFDFNDKAFLRDLSDNEDGDNLCEALDRCVVQSDMDTCIGILYEFIITYIKEEARDQEKDEP